VDTSSMAVGEVVDFNVDGLADIPEHDIMIVVQEL
jgi:hypothetical protein